MTPRRPRGPAVNPVVPPPTIPPGKLKCQFCGRTRPADQFEQPVPLYYQHCLGCPVQARPADRHRLLPGATEVRPGDAIGGDKPPSSEAVS